MNETDLKYTQAALNNLGQEIVDYMKQYLKDHNKDATGHLIDSIQYEIESKGDGMELRILSASYLKNVDQGRKAGKMPPSKALIPWIRAKGMKSGKGGKSMTIEQAAYALALHIRDNDIPGIDIIDSVKKWIISQKKDEISESAGKDVNRFIQNLFNE